MRGKQERTQDRTLRHTTIQSFRLKQIVTNSYWKMPIRVVGDNHSRTDPEIPTHCPSRLIRILSCVSNVTLRFNSTKTEHSPASPCINISIYHTISYWDHSQQMDQYFNSNKDWQIQIYYFNRSHPPFKFIQSFFLCQHSQDWGSNNLVEYSPDICWDILTQHDWQ